MAWTQAVNRGGGARPAVGWNLRKSRSRRGEFAVFRTRIGVKKIPHPGKLSAFQDVTNSARGSLFFRGRFRRLGSERSRQKLRSSQVRRWLSCERQGAGRRGRGVLRRLQDGGAGAAEPLQPGQHRHDRRLLPRRRPCDATPTTGPSGRGRPRLDCIRRFTRLTIMSTTRRRPSVVARKRAVRTLSMSAPPDGQSGSQSAKRRPPCGVADVRSNRRAPPETPARPRGAPERSACRHVFRGRSLVRGSWRAAGGGGSAARERGFARAADGRQHRGPSAERRPPDDKPLPVARGSGLLREPARNPHRQPNESRARQKFPLRWPPFAKGASR